MRARTRRDRHKLVIAACAWLFASEATKGQVVWDGGGGNTRWGTDLNWSTDNVPTDADRVSVPGMNLAIRVDSEAIESALDLNSLAAIHIYRGSWLHVSQEVYLGGFQANVPWTGSIAISFANDPNNNPDATARLIVGTDSRDANLYVGFVGNNTPYFGEVLLQNASSELHVLGHAYVGYGGRGRILHENGVASIAGTAATLHVGWDGIQGDYVLIDGRLEAGEERIGDGAAGGPGGGLGVFSQDGGLNQATRLTLGNLSNAGLME